MRHQKKMSFYPSCKSVYTHGMDHRLKVKGGMELRERIALIRGYVTVHVLTFLL